MYAHAHALAYYAQIIPYIAALHASSLSMQCQITMSTVLFLKVVPALLC
jgi:hypothetical protein